MLSRKVLTRSGRGFRMGFPSMKLGRMVKCESILERDAVLLLEYSPGVLSYQEQPALINYWDGEQMRVYFPDFEALLSDGSRVHLEIKPSNKLSNPKTAAKYRAIAAHYSQTSIQFRIVTELECQREPLHSNLRRLNYLRSKLMKEPLLPLADLTRRLGQMPITLATSEMILGAEMTQRLLASGRLYCDPSAAIGPDTLVSVMEGECRAALLF